MSALSAAKTILEADATLAATAIGGVWDFDETGRLGLSRSLTPTAFDNNGILKPSILLKLRSATPDFALADDATGYISVREVIEVWFYQDTGYASIETMRERVYALLHRVQLPGTFQCHWRGDVRGQRDTDLDAGVERSEFTVYRARSA